MHGRDAYATRFCANRARSCTSCSPAGTRQTHPLHRSACCSPVLMTRLFAERGKCLPTTRRPSSPPFSLLLSTAAPRLEKSRLLSPAHPQAGQGRPSERIRVRIQICPGVSGTRFTCAMSASLKAIDDSARTGRRRHFGILIQRVLKRIGA